MQSHLYGGPKLIFIETDTVIIEISGVENGDLAVPVHIDVAIGGARGAKASPLF